MAWVIRNPQLCPHVFMSIHEGQDGYKFNLDRAVISDQTTMNQRRCFGNMVFLKSLNRYTQRTDSRAQLDDEQPTQLGKPEIKYYRP